MSEADAGILRRAEAYSRFPCRAEPRILATPILNDRRRVVGRTVIDDENFERSIAILQHQGFETGGEILAPDSADDHADRKGTGHRTRCRRANYEATRDTSRQC